MNDYKIKIEKANSSLLMFGIFSVVMLFAGLTSAYIVSKGSLGSSWDNIILPSAFYISTTLIVISSFSASLSISYCKKNNLLMLNRLLLITILLGFSFAICQFFGWRELVDMGKYLSGNNVSSSYLYILTIVHLVHIIGGLAALLYVYIRSLSNIYNSSSFHGIKLAMRFWHFLGLLWIYLVFFISFL